MLMFFVGLLSVAYITAEVDAPDETSYWNGTSFSAGRGSVDASGWYDENNRLCVYENLTSAVGEDGHYEVFQIGSFWHNDSGMFPLHFGVRDYSPAGIANAITVSFAAIVSGSFVAVLTAGIAMFFVLGLTLVGSGLSGESARSIATLAILGLLWAVVSAAGITGLTGGMVLGHHIDGLPYGLGWLMVTFLTMVYVIGAYQSVSGGSSN